MYQAQRFASGVLLHTPRMPRGPEQREQQKPQSSAVTGVSDTIIIVLNHSRVTVKTRMNWQQ